MAARFAVKSEPRLVPATSWLFSPSRYQLPLVEDRETLWNFELFAGRPVDPIRGQLVARVQIAGNRGRPGRVQDDRCAADRDGRAGQQGAGFEDFMGKLDPRPGQSPPQALAFAFLLAAALALGSWKSVMDVLLTCRADLENPRDVRLRDTSRTARPHVHARLHERRGDLGLPTVRKTHVTQTPCGSPRGRREKGPRSLSHQFFKSASRRGEGSRPRRPADSFCVWHGQILGV